MATLTISTSEGELSYELTAPNLTLGRSDDNSIVVDDESISSNHAEIVLNDDGDYEVSDLGSTNGIKISGERISEPTVLEHGASILFGHVQASFLTELATEPTPIPDEDAVPGGVGPATTALTPDSFTNASPFGKKSKPKDPGAQAVLAFGLIALAVALLAIVCALIMNA